MAKVRAAKIGPDAGLLRVERLELRRKRIFFCSTLRGANERLEKDPTFACVRHVI